jgi:protein O-mannosyl-transferase
MPYRNTGLSNLSQFACLGLLGVLILAVFWQAIGFDYVNYDDGHLVQYNERLQQAFSLEFLHWAFTTTEGSNWNPLLWVSYALDRRLFSDPASGHHAANLFYHWLNSILVYSIVIQMRAGQGLALCCAAIFAVHPQHVEAVAWIMSRKDLLSTGFGLTAILIYLNRQNKSRGFGFWLLTTSLMSASIMVKPMLVTLPCILLLLDYWPLERGANAPLWRTLPNLVLEKWPLFLVSLIGSFIAYQAHNSGEILLEPTAQVVFGNIVNAYWIILTKFFLPISLSPYYPSYVGGIDSQTILALAVLLGLSLAAWKCARTAPQLTVGWLWFLGTLFPASGVIHFSVHGVADRFSYLPHIGLIWASVMGVNALIYTPRLRPFLASAVIISGAALSWLQTTHWQNGITLFRHAHKIVGDEPFVLSALAVAHFERGEVLEAVQYNLKGLDSIHAGALASRTTRYKLWRNGGLYLIEYGQFEEGIYYLKNALELDPGSKELRKLLLEAQETYLQQ